MSCFSLIQPGQWSYVPLPRHVLLTVHKKRKKKEATFTLSSQFPLLSATIIYTLERCITAHTYLLHTCSAVISFHREKPSPYLSFSVTFIKSFLEWWQYDIQYQPVPLQSPSFQCISAAVRKSGYTNGLDNNRTILLNPPNDMHSKPQSLNLNNFMKD